jgi:MoaA/NifB/PqqE/SkfB family radical SAM enzyme
LKIKDYLAIDADKEAKLKEIATFSAGTDLHKGAQRQRLSPFDRALIESALPGAGKAPEEGIPYPVAAMVRLSHVCTHNCSGCAFGTKGKTGNVFADPDNFPRLLESLRCLKVRSIHLSGGGEPTLHPEFDRFAQMCVLGNFNLSLLTNAVSFKAATIELLAESLYNRIHHPPHPREFQRVVANLEKVVTQRERRESSLIVGADVWLCQANMNFMEEITGLVRDLGLDYIQFRINRRASDYLLRDQVEGVNNLLGELIRSHHPFPVYGEPRSTKLDRACRFFLSFLVVGPSGDVYVCSRFAQDPEIVSFGNIFRLSPDRLWFGPVHRRVIEQLKQTGCHIKDCRWRICSDLMRLPEEG